MFGQLLKMIYSRSVFNTGWIFHLLSKYLPFQYFFDSMAYDMMLRGLQMWGELTLDTIGLIHWPKRNRLPPITDPLLLQSATELSSRIRSGQLKSETVLRAFIDRVRAVNGLINAVVDERFEAAIAEARHLDSRVEAALRDPQLANDNVLDLPLLGIPITIKESIAVKGMPLTGGLYSRKECRVEVEATTVKQVKEAGAIVIGVTNIPEFLLWWDTNNRLYGRTNNPYDLSRICGGSSGGEGAIISAAGSVIGLGSDIGGSIRIPSYFCGIFGHKPSSHIMPDDGSYPYCGHEDREKLFVIGPMCRYAEDLKLVLKQILLKDPKLKAELDLDKPVDLSKSKFYFLTDDRDPLKPKVCKQVKSGIWRARNYLEQNCGFSCQTVEFPLMRYSFWIFLAHLQNNDAPKLAAEIMERKGELNGYTELAKSFLGMSKFRKISCMNVIAEDTLLTKFKNSGAFDKMIQFGDTLKSQVESLLDDDSILILPCLPSKAPKHNGTFLRVTSCGYTSMFNLFEMPVTQVTMGVDKKTGLPFGFQVVAKRLNDRYTIAVAELLAKEFGGWNPPCEVKLN